MPRHSRRQLIRWPRRGAMPASMPFWRLNHAAFCLVRRWRARWGPASSRCANPANCQGPVLEARYALEYGNDVLQVQADAVAPGTRVLLVDDVLATGGTLLAAQVLAQRLGAEIAGASVLMELAFLNGRSRWNGPPLRAALVV